MDLKTEMEAAKSVPVTEAINNTSKPKRRERLSARDHERAAVIGQSIRNLLAVLEKMYPADLELRIAAPAIERFINTTAAAAVAAADE